MTALKVGQIWKENDSRRERYVEILAIYPSILEIRTVKADGSIIAKARRWRAMPSRFNGKRGGYSLHKDI